MGGSLGRLSRRSVGKCCSQEAFGQRFDRRGSFARWAGRPRGAPLATLVTGIFRAGWHLLLLVYAHLPWYDLIFFSLAFQVIISWLFDRTSGSVLIVMLFHMSSNVVFGGIMPPLFEGADASRYHMLFVVLTCVVALSSVSRAGWP